MYCGWVGHGLWLRVRVQMQNVPLEDVTGFLALRAAAEERGTARVQRKGCVRERRIPTR